MNKEYSREQIEKILEDKRLSFYIIGNEGDDEDDILLKNAQIISSGDEYIDIGFTLSKMENKDE